MKHLTKILLLLSVTQVLTLQQAFSYSNTFADEFNRIQNYINQEMRRMDDDFWGRSRMRSSFDHKWDKPYSTHKLIDKKIENVKNRLTRLKTLTEQHEEYLEQLKKQQKALDKSYEKSSSHNFNITDKHDDDSYKVIFELPCFDEKDLKIEVNHRKKRLTITGNKQAAQDKSSEELSIQTYQKVSMYQNVNNKKKELNFDNGELEINVDLPENVDTENFKSTFDDNELTIKFKIQK